MSENNLEAKDKLHNLLPIRERAQSQSGVKPGLKDQKQGFQGDYRTNSTAKKKNLPKPKGITYVPIT